MIEIAILWYISGLPFGLIMVFTRWYNGYNIHLDDIAGVLIYAFSGPFPLIILAILMILWTIQDVFTWLFNKLGDVKIFEGRGR